MSSYLIQCIESLPPHKIAEEDVLLVLSTTLSGKDEFFIYDERMGLDEEPFATLDESPKAYLDELYDSLVNLYNSQEVSYTIDTADDVWVSMTVGRHDIPETVESMGVINKDYINRQIRYSFNSPIFTSEDFDRFAEIITELQKNT